MVFCFKANVYGGRPMSVFPMIYFKSKSFMFIQTGILKALFIGSSGEDTIKSVKLNPVV